MRRIYKTLLLTATAILTLFLAKDFSQSKTDGFTLAGITPNRAFDPRFETRPPSATEKAELQRALDQPYSYKGYGAQSFVFFSSDGKYVIKFIKQRYYRAPFWCRLPTPFFLDKYKKKKVLHRKEKQLRDFYSYKLALEKLQDLSGTVFVHLNPTSSLQKKLRVTDKIGIVHEIDLDKADFVIQKRAELVHARIDRLMQEGQTEKAKESISSLVQLILTRCARGIKDRDPSIDTNCGFLEDKAIKIDIGRFRLSPSFSTPRASLAQLEKITAPFKAWLSSRYPELATHLEQECEKTKTHFFLPL